MPTISNSTLHEAERSRLAIAATYHSNNNAIEAFNNLKRLSGRFPNNVGILVDCSVTALICGEYAVAREMAYRILALAPDSLDAVDRVAQVLNATGAHDHARDAWMTLKQGKSRESALTALAGMAMRQNQIAEAEDLIQQALALGRTNPMTLLIAGQLALKTRQFDIAERFFIECSAESIPAMARFRALYYLGDLYDEQSQFECAVVHWRRAKAAIEQSFGDQVKRSRAMRQLRLRRNHETIQKLGSTNVAQWRQTRGSSHQPSFAILAGHPRSGTTLMEQVMASHPTVIDLDEKDVVGCAIKAILLRGKSEYLSLDTISTASPLQLSQIRNDYLRRISMLHGRLTNNVTILDKNPNLTDSLPMLLPIFPGLKILVVRRDPKDVLLSCFRLAVTPDAGNVGWLREEDAIEDFQSMMSVWERLRDGLQSDQGWLEVQYEQLCTDFWSTVKSVTQFLGLEWHSNQENYRLVRAGAQIASPTYSEVSQPVDQRAIGRWQRYADLLPELFAPFIKE